MWISLEDDGDTASVIHLLNIIVVDVGPASTDTSNHGELTATAVIQRVREGI
jgi:hypothetical protein